MADICYPPSTDWSCKWTAEQLAEQRADAIMGPKIALAEAFAWSMLAAWTLYRIGTCPITVRPCAERCMPASRTYRTAVARGGYVGAAPQIGMLNPYISGGQWFNACGCRPGGCACDALSAVELPGPVGGIVEVRVDGVALEPSAYKVMNGNRLVRTDGEDWPICQDMALSDDDGFSVTYYRGARPNMLTNAAAGVLANEYLLACDQSDQCRLPLYVTSMMRSGESYDFDPQLTADAIPLIPEVQAVVRIYNPAGLKSPVIVASPDMYRTPMRTA